MRLREIRKSLGLTQKEVADQIGITQNAYSYWESGKVRIDNKSLEKLAEFFDVSVDELFDISDNSRKIAEIPVYDNLPTNHAITTTTLLIPSNSAKSMYFGLIARGNAMYPEIKDGDLLILKKQNNFDENDKTYAFSIGNEVPILRRVNFMGDRVKLTPINPEYCPRFYSREEFDINARAYGKVLEIRREADKNQ